MSPPPIRPRRAPAGVKVAAKVLPIARVAVDVSLAHLDRSFDYLVAEGDDDAAQPGTRVRVRFHGRLLDGYVLERAEVSDYDGRLMFLERVVSAEQVLTPEVARLARAVADRYAGSMADVLRLAVPPRHARAEVAKPAGHSAADPSPDDPKPAGPNPADQKPVQIDRTRWQVYRAGDAFLTALQHGRPVRAVWQALPGEDWPARLAEAAAVAAGSGRGALLVVPDAKDLDRLDTALRAHFSSDHYVTLAADLGPSERYKRFLRLSRGQVKVVAGTRATAFAPVNDVGLVAVFDDGDDLLAESRAPYPDTREVLMLRSAAERCALLVGGYARTAEAELLLTSGWARPIVAHQADVEARAPRIEAEAELVTEIDYAPDISYATEDELATGSYSAAARARLSPAAFDAAREALASGRPVLVQVPRSGYFPALYCARCRRPARCRHCHGPLAMGGVHRLPGCRWCGIAEARFNCPACGSEQFRSPVVGATRTAEELGRAFPGVRLITSSGDSVRSSVPDEPAIVVATPGAEPVGSYGAALLLDGFALLGRPDLRAAEETLRRWMAAAAMVVPASVGGRVVVGADGSLQTVQALIRWDPARHAAAELAARSELGFPPAVAMASIQGSEPEIAAAAESLDLPPGGEILGPVLLADLTPKASGRSLGNVNPAETARILLRVPSAGRKQLAAAVKALAAIRSARKDEENLRLRIDPDELF